MESHACFRSQGPIGVHPHPLLVLPAQERNVIEHTGTECCSELDDAWVHEA